ncbi:MAG TPA: ABC transporter ATP-binding protein [Nitrococcus sp.]|nr:ABC transporter ATP-binding protein [Nitrococcus sp.]
MKSPPVIELKGITAGYGGPIVLQDVTLDVGAGEFLGLVGPNGGGKSTLLKVILGLLAPIQGRVRVLGVDPLRARRHVGYVSQYVEFARDFPISVRGVVLMGRLGQSPPWLGYRRSDRAIAMSSLREVGLAELSERPIEELSGGQFQRVLIARALAAEPEILLLDEPTANLDPRAERDLFELLKNLNRRMTILVVTHDIAFVSEYVTRVACLSRELVCHTTEPLTAETIERLYGRPIRLIQHEGHG